VLVVASVSDCPAAIAQIVGVFFGTCRIACVRFLVAKLLISNCASEAHPGMLYTFAVILPILLLLNLLNSFSAEGEIHSLLVIAILGIVIRVIQARGITCE
jgi:hypothetical protein